MGSSLCVCFSQFKVLSPDFSFSQQHQSGAFEPQRNRSYNSPGITRCSIVPAIRVWMQRALSSFKLGQPGCTGTLPPPPISTPPFHHDVPPVCESLGLNESALLSPSMNPPLTAHSSRPYLQLHLGPTFQLPTDRHLIIYPA